MRILHISKYYYPYIGGVENICKYIVEGMPQHATAVVCFSEGRENRVDEVNGVMVYVHLRTWARNLLDMIHPDLKNRLIENVSK